MLMSFADESATTSELVPVVAVGGAIGSGMQWGRASRAWNKVLKSEPDVKLFHTRDFESPEGQLHSVYRDWPSERRNAFNRSLTEALSSNHLGMVSAACVRIDDFEQVLKDRGGAHKDVTPYFFCTMMFVQEQARWAEQFFPNEEITCYFEAGGPQEKAFKKAYESTAAADEVNETLRWSRQPTFVPKDRYIELQIADKLVYECAKHASHYFVDIPPEKFAFRTPDGQTVWKTRFSPDLWTQSGLDINCRGYTQQMIHDSLDEMGW